MLPLSEVKELDLSHNKLKDEGIEVLFQTIARLNCYIEKVNLIDTGFTLVGFKTIARVVKRHVYLKELILDHNNLNGYRY